MAVPVLWEQMVVKLQGLKDVYTERIIVVIVDVRTAEITRSCGRRPVLLRFSSMLKLIRS